MDGLDVDGLVRDLETLKQRLVLATPADLAVSEADLLAAQVSAIRLQLKRLAADRVQAAGLAALATPGAVPGPPPERRAPPPGP